MSWILKSKKILLNIVRHVLTAVTLKLDILHINPNFHDLNCCQQQPMTEEQEQCTGDQWPITGHDMGLSQVP